MLRKPPYTRCVILLIVFPLLITCLFFGCSKTDSGADATGAQTKGTIRVSGAWALYPMMVRWAEEFNKTYPQIRVDVSAGGAGKGAADALAGLTDMGMVSREIKAEEIKQGAFFIPVVKDAVFPTINSSNPDLKGILSQKGVTRKIFTDLWIHGKSTTWGEIGSNKALKERVQVYTRSDSCGAAETWAAYLGGKNQEDLKGIGVYGDPGVADAVKKDPLAIGFNNLNYAYDPKTGLPVAGLQVAPIDVNENGKVDPEEDLSTKEKAIKAVTSGLYPSPPARALYLLAKEQFKGPARIFVKWILTDGQKFVDEVGYIRLTEDQIKEMLKKLDK
jgi:phosphate transport system substrate-binding protein